MKVLYSWIEELARTGADGPSLAEKLTMLGLEVEHAHAFGGAIAGLTTGVVKTCVPHPDSDHLSLCAVEVPGETLRIVCGADNVRAGISVPVARVGCELPGGFKIKKAKIRGVESSGMLCSKEELGLEEKSKGIWILPEGTPAGLASEAIIGTADWVYSCAIGSNRPDCLSVFGLAREAAAAWGHAAPKPAGVVKEDSSVPVPSIEIRDADLCPRYSARVIRGVKVGPSPARVAARLEACGVRSINNVVDATNLVLLELGHPLHAFDLARLAGGRIVVRRAAEGEKMATLDGVERVFSAETLVIADAERPVALAGVMGGQTSEVSAETVDVLLESAYFDPVSIRRTSRRVGLSTEASYRFERGTDPDGTVDALDRCAALIVELAGGACGPLADNVARPFERRKAALRQTFLSSKLGCEIPLKDAYGILARLGFELGPADDELLTVTVPSWRPDIALEVDLVEEVVRHYGYDRLPARLFPVRVNEAVTAARDYTGDAVRAALVEHGLTEVVNFDFTLPEDLPPFGFDPEACVNALNPMSSDQRHLRPSLLPNLARNLRTNLERGERDLAFCELGKVFAPAPGKQVAHETLRAAVALTGLAEPAGWLSPAGRAWDFYDLKGAFARLAARLRLPAWDLAPGAGVPYLHPGQAATIRCGGRTLGVLGALHPAVLRDLDISQPVHMMEIELGDLAALRGEPGSVRLASRFPSLHRDLAFVMPEPVVAGALEATIRAAAESLGRLRLLSVYRGPQLGAGKKCLAFSLEFACPDRTMSDEEAERIVSAVVERAGREHGAVLR